MSGVNDPTAPISAGAPWRVEVFRRPGIHDPEGAHALQAVRELGIESVRAVRLGRGYLLPGGWERGTVEAVAREVLVDPVLEEARLAAPGEGPGGGIPHRILVAPRPGVTDPVAETVAALLARGASENGGERVPAAPPHVGSFRAWELEGDPSPEELGTIGRRVLANETIEHVVIDGGALPYGPVPGGDERRGRVEVPLLAAAPEELEELSRAGQLSLSRVEMLAIQEHYRALGREPTACELETLAQTWSEHCKHKTLTGIIELEEEDGSLRRIDNLLKSTVFRATSELDRPWCVSVFEDNAGIVAFDEGWDVCFKVETHNHPSAIDPYGGAGTGIGGVIRDILGAGLGARPIASTDAFFVGPLDLPAEALPPGCMHPRRILRGVVAGVRDYGNRMGIPTVGGGVWFHERYVGNPLVYAGTVGVLPSSAARKEVRPGDAVVAVGGRTGRDGIHGATFSSLELDVESEELSSSAVQIGDPITEKRVLDCQLVARDRGLYRSVTDCGAGGFSSAVGEMGEHTGAEVELDAVELKYPGLASHEIWISEAQERMVFAVPQEGLEEFLAVFAAEGVPATVIGRFTGDGRLVVRDRGEVVAELDMGFLHGGTPRPVRRARWRDPELPDPGCPPAADPGAALLALLGAPNVCSRAWIVRQYDHEVQGGSVIKPLVGPRGDGPGDAAVIQPLPEGHAGPGSGSRRGLAIACGANPEYGLLDPWAMAAAAVDEALRNAVAVGGDPERAALLDNFSWGNCDKPDRLGSLVRAAEACRDAALAYGTPFISGKDSLNNEYRVGGESLAIPPTLLISALAPVPDVGRALSMDLKQAGNAVYLVGLTGPELGGSQWLLSRGLAGGRVPRPDLALAPALLRRLHAALAAGLARSCHDLSEGGLAVAAAEMAFAGGLGLELELARVPAGELPAGHDRDAALLFSESCTRFLVEVEPGRAAAFEAALAGEPAIPLAAVGRVLDEPALVLRGTGGGELARLDLDALRAAHAGDFGG